MWVKQKITIFLGGTNHSQMGGKNGIVLPTLNPQSMREAVLNQYFGRCQMPCPDCIAQRRNALDGTDGTEAFFGHWINWLILQGS